MKKIFLAICVMVGLAFGSEVKNDEIKEREVKLSQLDWADVQRGVAASNRYYFAEQKVALVITNKIEDIPGIPVIHYGPMGRMPEKIDDRNKRSLLLEPKDYIK